ncbi:MAG: hypothetical protein WCI72_01875 [archaeon]
MFGNKKGQGESGGAIVVFVLILIIAAVIAYATYAFFFKINTTIDAQGIETTNMILSCQKDLQLANTDDAKYAAYCGNFKTPLIVGGKKSYVNCKFLELNSLTSFTDDEAPKTVKERCTTSVSNLLAYKKCSEFNTTRADDGSNWAEYINGMKCTKTFTAVTFKITDADVAASIPAAAPIVPTPTVP